MLWKAVALDLLAALGVFVLATIFAREECMTSESVAGVWGSGAAFGYLLFGRSFERKAKK